MSVQTQIERLNAIKERIRTNLVAQGVTVPADTMLEAMAEQILSVAGEDGADGTSVTVSNVSESTASGGINTVTFSDGKKVNIKNGINGTNGTNGKNGTDGKDGQDGYSPVRGVDYWTEADRASIVREVMESIGTPVFGIVDENNNIILTGELGDGTYTIKYEMEDGSTVEIGDLVLDTNVYYSVTNNLTQCTNSNSATEVVEGESYSATITAKSGYELKSVSVTMGGTPVTVSGGEIDIASVTGNIVITAVAEEQAVAPAYKNWLPLSVDADGNDYKGDNGEDGYKTGYRLSTSSGNESALSGACVTGFIPFNKVNDVFRIKNMTLHDTSFNANGLVIYDANKSRVYGVTSQSAGNFAGSITADGNGVYKFFPGNWTSVTTGNGFIRFSCGGISDDTIVTINEEIV